MGRLGKRLRSQQGFNLIEGAAVVAAIGIFILLLYPLLHSSGGESTQNMEAQTQLTSALSQTSTALKKTFTGISPKIMQAKAPGFTWVGNIPPTSPKMIAIGGASSGNTVVLCTQSASKKYFCVKQTSGSKAYGESYSYYDAETTQLSAWPTS